MGGGVKWAIALAGAALVAIAAWLTADRWWPGGGDATTSLDVPASIAVPDATTRVPEVVSVGQSDLADPNFGATPMPQRVAVVGLLNKRNGESRAVTLKPGQATRIGDVIIRLRACERTAPWETDELTGAFVQLDVKGSDNRWRRSFSGWLYKERPALNVVQHGVYDVWAKSCAMTFPVGGPDTVALSGPSAGKPSRSSASKSPATDGAPSARPAPPAPSAADNSET